MGDEKRVEDGSIKSGDTQKEKDTSYGDVVEGIDLVREPAYAKLKQGEGIFDIPGEKPTKRITVIIQKVQFFYQRWEESVYKDGCISLDGITGYEGYDKIPKKCSQCPYIGHGGGCYTKVRIEFNLYNKNDTVLTIRGASTSAKKLEKYLELLKNRGKEINKVITRITSKEREFKKRQRVYWLMEFFYVKDFNDDGVSDEDVPF